MDPADGKDGRGREGGETSAGVGEGAAHQDLLTQEAGAQAFWGNKPRCPAGLRSTPISLEEGNRKETILDPEHKRSSPGREGEDQDPESQACPRLRMSQDTRGQCLSLPGSKT